MEQISFVFPPGNLCCPGFIAVVDMETEKEIARGCAGEKAVVPSDEAIDIGIASVRLGAPAVRFRFMARPGKTYRIYWTHEGFGASFYAVEEK